MTPAHSRQVNRKSAGDCRWKLNKTTDSGHEDPQFTARASVAPNVSPVQRILDEALLPHHGGHSAGHEVGVVLGPVADQMAEPQLPGLRNDKDRNNENEAPGVPNVIREDESQQTGNQSFQTAGGGKPRLETFCFQRSFECILSL